MVQELRTRSQADQIFRRALSPEPMIRVGRNTVTAPRCDATRGSRCELPQGHAADHQSGSVTWPSPHGDTVREHQADRAALAAIYQSIDADCDPQFTGICHDPTELRTTLRHAFRWLPR